MDVADVNNVNNNDLEYFNSDLNNNKYYEKYIFGVNPNIDKKINNIIIDISNGVYKIDSTEFSGNKEEESIMITLDDDLNIKVKEIKYKKLSKSKYVKLLGNYKKFKQDDEVTCPICLENIIENEYVRELKCNHVYHKKCIDRWLYTSDQYLCPYCKIDCKL